MGIFHTIRQDLVYAFRTLRTRPAFTTTAVITLALAIGGNTAMFTVIRAVLLEPLHYPGADRLARLEGGATPTRFLELQAGARSFTEIGAFTGIEDLALSGAAEPEVLKAVHVSANFLRILSVQPLLGRSFRAEEDAPGAHPVAMISDELWRRRFSGDSQIIGKTAVFAAVPYTIVGVLPPRFQFPSSGIDVWLPAPSELPGLPQRARELSPFLSLFARIKPGLSFQQANAEAQVVRRQYALAHPAMLDGKPRSPEVTPLKDDLVSSVRSILWILFGAVGLVLLIACANMAGLLLARAASRSREMAVRSAIGAARTRLVAQLLAESVLLSLAGGALGVILAALALRAIPNIASFTIPRAGEIQPDWTVLGFAAALSFTTGVAFGLAPALRASR
ncbi:MAG TPA: ABC transporter permease, partial [Bryobacteraceae bacterium]|nr:ABC transporter permease [Bryobacteraceae bacterium]